MQTVIEYCCDECGIQDMRLLVPSREDESVDDWMGLVSYHIRDNHVAMSPDCKTKKISRIKIPMTGTAKIGGPVIN